MPGPRVSSVRPAEGYAAAVAKDSRFLSAPDLDAMSPDERAAALNERIVTDLQTLPEEFRDRVLAPASAWPPNVVRESDTTPGPRRCIVF